ncbi:MAG: hypothetical protein PHT07_21140 [Paludibacter sp.]|nr:hypothetical protein [Paludibacter sp.]
MKTSHKILFWVGMLILAILSFSVDISASPKHYKGQAKQELKFAHRKASNLDEQARIQSPGIKHYNKRNPWQKGRH